MYPIISNSIISTLVCIPKKFFITRKSDIQNWHKLLHYVAFFVQWIQLNTWKLLISCGDSEISPSYLLFNLINLFESDSTEYKVPNHQIFSLKSPSPFSLELRFLGPKSRSDLSLVRIMDRFWTPIFPIQFTIPIVPERNVPRSGTNDPYDYGLDSSDKL